MQASISTSAFKLREYQKTLVEQIITAIRRKETKSPLIQLPTGGGKTIIFCEIAKYFNKILVIAHRNVLLKQLTRKFEENGMEVGFVHRKVDRNKRVLVGTNLQTYNMKDIPVVDLIIIDEAHRSCANTYKQIIERMPPETIILGASATPSRLDGKGLDILFDALFQGPSVKDLIHSGYLSDYSLYGALKVVQADHIQKRGGDYARKALEEATDSSFVKGDLVESYRKYANGKRCIVYHPGVNFAQRISQEYNEVGIPSEIITGNTNEDERDRIIQNFIKGEILCIHNVEIATEGVDIPTVEAIQIVCKTASITKYLQMIGRALRPCPEKNKAIIIDHTDNWLRLGLPDDKRNWTLCGKNNGESQNTEPVKCPECGFIDVKRNFTETGKKIGVASACPSCNEVLFFRPDNELEELSKNSSFLSQILKEVDPNFELLDINNLDDSVGLMATICAAQKKYDFSGVWLVRTFCRFSSIPPHELSPINFLTCTQLGVLCKAPKRFFEEAAYARSDLKHLSIYWWIDFAKALKIPKKDIKRWATKRYQKAKQQGTISKYK